jgi:hypothetical protein
MAGGLRQGDLQDAVPVPDVGEPLTRRVGDENGPGQQDGERVGHGLDPPARNAVWRAPR